MAENTIFDAAPQRHTDGRHAALRPKMLARELRRLHGWLPSRDRARLRWLLALAIIGAMAEALTIVLLVPFLAILAGAGEALEGGASATLSALAGIDLAASLGTLAPVIAALILASAALRLALLVTRVRLVENVAHELGTEIYRRALHQPYERASERNSSTIIAGIEKVRGLAVGVLDPAVEALSAALMASLIVAALIVIEPWVTLGAAAVLVVMFLVSSAWSRRAMTALSAIMASGFTKRIQLVREGLGGLRDIKIAHSEALRLDEFRQVDAEFRDAKASAALLTQSPGILLEGALLAGLVIAAGLLFEGTGTAIAVLPTIGAMAYALRRLMPLWQKIYALKAALSTYSGLLADVLELVHAPVEADRKTRRTVPPPRDAIRLEGVSYLYPGSDRTALDDVDLSIQVGEAIGLMGASGAGKSTLVDLFAGLILPTKGRVTIDGVALDAQTRDAWQERLSYVPQSIHLLDASIAQNIAFGSRGELDEDRLREAARAALIEEFIETLPEGYATRMREGGARLSGGQRQRIGIARALYRQPEVLILDEATSALDPDTERQILQHLAARGDELTVLAIAHQATSLTFCDRIYLLREGCVAALEQA
jgi:ATP-binding cassette subfamily B protein